MNVLDLFSGIGGFSLGLERAGMRTVAFCEIDPYCQAILRKHWPNVPCYGDVTTLTADRLCGDGIIKKWILAYPRWGQSEKCASSDGFNKQRSSQRRRPEQSANEGIDIICGGFPCQDISVAGKGAGIEGERSGLWKEYARIIGEVRPRYVIVENVAALLGRGLGVVLGDLAALGYDAEWHCIPASAVGAPHRRDRVWIVAYSRCERRQQVAGSAYGNETTHEGRAAQYDHQLASHGEGNGTADVAHSNRGDRYGRRGTLQMGWGALAREIADNGEFGRAQWSIEPDVGRVAHGVPFRVDRLKALGNAIVPQIAEIIGKAIMAREGRSRWAEVE